MDSISEIVRRQQAFFRSGATRPRSFRLEQLEVLRRAVQATEPDLYSALWHDLHKGEFETYTAEVALLYGEIRHARRHLNAWMRRHRVSTPLLHAPASSYTVHRPLGVSVVLSPWNYPFQLAIAPLIAAIAAGNTAVVKPSEFAPATAAVIEKMISGYFDPAHVACVTGDGTVAAELTSAPVDHIFFTGSTRVGRTVMKAAAERLVPVTLELGGKSPAIVTESARIGVTARRILWGKMLNAGQTCVAPDYVVAHRSVVEELLAALSRAQGEFFPDGPQTSSDYGRIINSSHYSRLADLMDRQGALGKPVLGGDRDPTTRYISPTVYHPVGWDDPVMEDELFGPLLPIIPYDSLEHVFDRIADRPTPLAAYLFTERRSDTDRFEQSISFGGATVNDTVVHLVNPELPFGGCGPSGMGNYHGFAGFRAFSHETSIMRRSSRFDVPLKYPPYKNALSLIRRVMRP
ncbi:MAG: aldehyde dehydrogenase family protein [Alkalispirochaeta sp.]